MSASYVLVLNRHSDELLHEEDSSVLVEQSAQGLMLVGPTRCKHKCLHQLQQGVSSEEFALREELLWIAVLHCEGIKGGVEWRVEEGGWSGGEGGGGGESGGEGRRGSGVEGEGRRGSGVEGEGEEGGRRG